MPDTVFEVDQILDVTVERFDGRITEGRGALHRHSSLMNLRLLGRLPDKQCFSPYQQLNEVCLRFLLLIESVVPTSGNRSLSNGKRQLYGTEGHSDQRG